MKTIDINCDMGEGYGPYTLGNDEEMLNVVSTVNLACGFHGGDPSIMFKILNSAKELGVAVGAHPGYPDLWGFGRRVIPFELSELRELLAYQIGALQAMAKIAGHKVTHAKVHGALGHVVSDEPETSAMFADLVHTLDDGMFLAVMAGSQLEKEGEARGMRLAHEIYADRAYMDDGRLMPRSQEGSVIHDANQSIERVLQMLDEQCLISHTGKRIPVAMDTICIHGDTPGAPATARKLREQLEKAGYEIRPFA